jgi:putative intracellular protease/amidase
LKRPRVLGDLSEDQVDAHDALFLPGGHGPMQDLVHSEPLGRIIRHFQAREKLVVAVCHGPAELLSATRVDGTWPFQGYLLTGFTNEKILAEANDALALIDQGTFGRCENCHREISNERFEAVPYARYCIRCARELQDSASR